MMKTRLPVPIRGVDRGAPNRSASPPAHVNFKIAEKPIITMSGGKSDKGLPILSTIPKQGATGPRSPGPRTSPGDRTSACSMSSTSLSSMSNSSSSLGKSPRTAGAASGSDGNGRLSSASNSRPSSSSSGNGVAGDQASRRKTKELTNSPSKNPQSITPKAPKVIRSLSNTETSAARKSPSVGRSSRASTSSSSGPSGKSSFKNDRETPSKPFPIPVKNQKSPRSPGKDHKQFEPYMMLEQVQHGLKRGELIEGILRINPKSYEDAYISVPGGQMDIYIGGIRDRNRALNGDVVAVEINKMDEWKIFRERTTQPGPEQGPIAAKPQEKTPVQAPAPSTAPVPQEPRENPQKQTRKRKPRKVVQTPEVHQTQPNKKEEVASVTEQKKKKKRKRYKKSEKCNKLQPDLILMNTQDILPGSSSKDPSHFSLSDVPKPPLHLLEESRNIYSLTAKEGSAQTCNFGCGDHEDARTGIVVAPDELSEVESVCSESGESTTKCDLTDSVIKITLDTEEKFLSKIPNIPIKLTQIETAKNEDSKEIVKEARREESTRNSQMIQKTGKVVCILEARHSRACCGNLKLMRDKNSTWAMFSPRDHRVPRMFIHMSQCPKDFLKNEDAYKNQIFIAKIVDWQNTGNARGELCKNLGTANDIDAETEAMLIENSVEYGELPDKLVEGGSIKIPWTIPDEEICGRKDLRSECIFTIDPSSAKDLDDALSCVHVKDDLYRVGVHIADVSYFVKEGTLLDLLAASRATSVYLIQKVVPMLPSLLCEELCSLNAGTDRLAFSVEWLISSKGKIYEEWMGKTVINSCAKLSYQHAQHAIEYPGQDFPAEDCPAVTAPWTSMALRQRVNQLHGIALNLRKKRVKNGALRLDQAKLQFVLNPETGLPTQFAPYNIQDSNRLIEEFMLLANMAVSQKIYKTFPKLALLRCHPLPDARQLTEVVESCANRGIELDPTSAGHLQASLTKLAAENEDSASLMSVLVHLLAKPMKSAEYFCSGKVEDPDEYSHYALSVPIYTHFTSPIRRYPDIIVHRQLAAALGLEDMHCTNEQELQKKAVHCNDKKLKAKIAQESSVLLYLNITIRDNGPFEEDASVCSVMDHSFDALLPRMGIVKRVYCEQLPLKSMLFTKGKFGMERLELVWPSRSQTEAEVIQVIEIFSKVKVVLLASKENGTLKVNAKLKDPR